MRKPLQLDEVGDLGAVIPVLEETATIKRRKVAGGKTVVRTVVETENRLLRETLEGQRVDVERITIERVVNVEPEVRTEGDVTIIPIVEERLIVEKQLILVEEIRVHRHATSEAVEVPITLRKQRAVVEAVDHKGKKISDPAEP